MLSPRNDNGIDLLSSIYFGVRGLLSAAADSTRAVGAPL